MYAIYVQHLVPCPQQALNKCLCNRYIPTYDSNENAEISLGSSSKVRMARNWQQN